MKKLTLRGVGKELERRLKRLAARENLSLNQTVLLLLRQATDPEANSPHSNRVGASLEEFIGIWSPAEQQEFNAATLVFKENDDAGWDSFFLGEASVSDDFLQERTDQFQCEREPL